MPHVARRILSGLTLLLAGTTAQAQNAVYGITVGGNGQQQLVVFNSATPGAVTTLGPTGVNLIGIDFRPSNGVLYGYDGSQVYMLNLTTGAATSPVDITPDLAGGTGGVDFNPVADRLRLVNGAGSSLRVDVGTGATIVDGSLAYATGDANFGNAPLVTAAAYTNSFAGTTTTTLHGIDARLGTLVTVNPPNAGTLNTVGSLGLGTLSTTNGFDIATIGGVNTAYFATIGAGALSQFYTIDLSTGAATLVGNVGGSVQLAGLAVSTVPEPGTWALLATGLVGVGVAARRRRTQG